MAKISDIAIIALILGGSYLLLGKFQEAGKGVQDALSGFGGGGINIDIGGSNVPISIPQLFDPFSNTSGASYLTEKGTELGGKMGVDFRESIFGTRRTGEVHGFGFQKPVPRSGTGYFGTGSTANFLKDIYLTEKNRRPVITKEEKKEQIENILKRVLK